MDDGVIVARTDSLGAGLTKQIAVTHEPGDLGDQYNAFLDVEEVSPENLNNGDVVINQGGKLVRPKRLPSNLFQFRAGTGEDRCVLDCITSLRNGADLLWIETEKPHIGQIGGNGQPNPGSHPQCEIGLQQQPLVQLDPQLQAAGVRCLVRRG